MCLEDTSFPSEGCSRDMGHDLLSGSVASTGFPEIPISFCPGKAIESQPGDSKSGREPGR